MLQLRRKIAKHYRTRTLAKVSVRFLLNKLISLTPQINTNISIQYVLKMATQHNFKINKIIVQYYFLIFREYLSESVFKKTNTDHPEKRKKILYYSPFPSHPGNHGNQSTIQKFGAALRAQGFHVDFVVLKSNLFDENDLKNMNEFWDSVHVIDNHNIEMCDTKVAPFDSWYGFGLGEEIGLHVRQRRSNIIICSYVFHSKILDYVPTTVRKIIDTHDKMANRHELLSSLGTKVEFFSCSESDEAQYLRRADIVFARNQLEADYFNRITGLGHSILVPHFEIPKFKSPLSPKSNKIGILASENSINYKIVSDFIKICADFFGPADWPFQLLIGGNVYKLFQQYNSEDILTSNKSVIFLKYIDDIKAFYQQVDLIIIPVSVGTGINVKTVEALSYGMPLLSTKIGIKGIDSDEPQYNYETINEMISAITGVIANDEEIHRLSAIAQSTYQQFYNKSLNTFIQAIEYSPVRCMNTLKISEDFIRSRLESFRVNDDRSMVVPNSLVEYLSLDGEGAETFIETHINRKIIHEPEFKIFQQINSESELILDIGANWGYSVASLWAMRPNNTIVSFEPIEYYKKVLGKIKEMYNNKYYFFMIRLGDQEHTARFMVPVINNTIISALATEKRNLDNDAMRDLAKNIINHTKKWIEWKTFYDVSIYEFNAPVKTLDQVIMENPKIFADAKIGGIKIDVERAEDAVLYGARKTLADNRPLIMLEGGNRNQKLHAYMLEIGYIFAEQHDGKLRIIKNTGSQINGFYVHVDQSHSLKNVE